MSKIEVLTVRDPDGGTDVTIFVDGVESHEYIDYGVDAGAGHMRSDWEQTSREIAADEDLTPAFKAAVLAARAAPPGAKYIEEDREDIDSLIAEMMLLDEIEVWSRYPDIDEDEDKGTDVYACEQASRAFVTLLTEAGYTAWLVHGDDAEQALVGDHFWVGYLADDDEDDWYIDFTARQFHNVPDALLTAHMTEWPLRWGGTNTHPVIEFRTIVEVPGE